MNRLAFALFALSATAALAGDGVALPTGFDGTYASEGMPCGTGEPITVKDGTLFGMEWGMSVTDLIEYPNDPDRVEASLLVSGGGEEWVESAVIRRESDGQGQVLVLDYPDGNRSIWTLCD